MSELFRDVLNASFQGGVVILAVLMLRLILKKAPKKYICLLWILVGLRLLVPFSIESSLSLQPNMDRYTTVRTEAEMPSQKHTVQAMPAVPEDAAMPDDAEAVYGDAFAVSGMDGVEEMEMLVIDWTVIAAGIWAAVACTLGIYSLISYIRLKSRVREAVIASEGVWECDRLDTAFILGYLRPRIYIPMGLTEKSKSFILAHERTHLKRGDHWVKLMGFAALAVHWFNPLVWAAYVLLCRDIEMACDERVVRDMGLEERKSYSAALLSCSSSRGRLAACPVAFGEVSVKQRIVSVLNYRKPRFWLTLLAVVAVIFVAVCFLTSPETDTTLRWVQDLTAEDVNYIEFFGHHYTSAEDERYTFYEGEDLLPVVELINQSRGSAVSDPEELDGGSVEFRVTMNDGTEHTVMNMGNTYLVIDGTYYDADYEWLSTWPETGESYLPWRYEEDGAFSNTGVEIRVEDITPEHLTMTFWQTDPSIGSVYLNGEWKLKVFVNDTWDIVAQWDTQHKNLITEDGLSLYVDWSDICGELAPGYYRLETTAAYVNDGGTEKHDFLAEFRIEGDTSEFLNEAKKVLDGIQSGGSYYVKSEQWYNGDNFLDGLSTTEYWKTGDSWMRMEKSYSNGTWKNRYAYMGVNGTYFDASGMDEEGAFLWQQVDMSSDAIFDPWLYSFDWDAQEIEYLSSHKTEDGYSIFVRVLGPYEISWTASEDYTAEFYFNESGNFQYVVLDIRFNEKADGVYQQDWIWETTYLLSADPEEIGAAIEQQYQAATSQS